ncbi:MAG: class I SAM-dependent methyltransferase [Marinoscillum sp.]
MYEKLEECPSCKYTKFSNHIICKDYSVSQESFALVKCDKCTLVFTNPRPDLEHIGQYYENADYISHTNKANNPINVIYKIVRNYTFHSKRKLIKTYTTGKRVLDFGCGSGAFINYLKSKNFQPEGYEPHPSTNQYAQDFTKLPIYHDLKQLKKQEKYDAITAWHVLEHVHELRDTLKALRKRLTDQGFMFLALPNHSSHDATLYGPNWAAYDVPRHLYHFNPESFAILVKNCKLQIVDQIPMVFDSYYVSLLSEKHITGKTNILKAAKMGYLSNQSAHKTGNYSSLIYILKK